MALVFLAWLSVQIAQKDSETEAKSNHKMFRLRSLHPKNERRVLGDPASPAPAPTERNCSARRGPGNAREPTSAQHDRSLGYKGDNPKTKNYRPQDPRPIRLICSIRVLGVVLAQEASNAEVIESTSEQPTNKWTRNGNEPRTAAVG